MRQRKLFSALLIFACVLIAYSCGGKKPEKSPVTGPPSVLEVKIEGMTCTGCEQTIQRNVGKLEGIKSVKATFTDGRAVIEYFPSLVDTVEIRSAISGSGYVVRKFTAENP